MARKRLIQKNTRVYSSTFSKRFLHFSVIVFVFALGFYIFSVNALASKGYQMRSAEEKISDLTEKYRDLQIRSAELSALHHTEKVSGELELGKPQEIQFVKEVGPVAIRY